MMNKTKRIVSLLLVGVLTLCLLAACSSTVVTDDPVIEQLDASSSITHLDALDACAKTYSSYYYANMYNTSTKATAMKTEWQNSVTAILTKNKISDAEVSVAIGIGKNRTVALENIVSNYGSAASGAKYYGIYDGKLTVIGQENYYIVVILVE